MDVVIKFVDVDWNVVDSLMLDLSEFTTMCQELSIEFAPVFSHGYPETYYVTEEMRALIGRWLIEKTIARWVEE